MEIVLDSGDVVIVDDCDYDRVREHHWYRWNLIGGDFYAVTIIKSKIVHLHRFIMDPERPDTTESLVIDHCSGNKSDNTRKNLRWATQQQNKRNCKLDKRSTTGYKGVNFHKTKGLYRAVIAVDKKQIHLGYFTTKEGAALCYNDAAKELFGEFARYNNVDESFRETPVVTLLINRNKSGFRGVSWNERLKQYTACIRRNSRTVHLGCFATAEEAAAAYDTAAREIYGNKALLNFPLLPTQHPLPHKAVLSKKNNSGFRGVSWHSRNHRWEASIKHQGRAVHIGVFLTAEEAARAYDDTACRLKGSKARVNFPSNIQFLS